MQLGWIVFLILGIYLINCIKILKEYERGVIFRLGRLLPEPKGPGLVLIFAPIDKIVRISLRVETMDVPPQDVVTRDNVTVKVSAVVFFRVVDPRRAVVEVEHFVHATSQLAQTRLRAILGEAELDELLSEREKLTARLQATLDEQTEPWGIKVQAVEVKARRPARADDPSHRAAGRGRARAARQGHPCRRRTPGLRETNPSGGEALRTADGYYTALSANAHRDRRGEEYDDHVPGADRPVQGSGAVGRCAVAMRPTPDARRVLGI